ncbi:MAG: hypothetical protein HY710_00685, partial [Candidatus Latescibacteria bacterium]|nr:hypothetical protein [Candidatus Latescibacterota bacterium]
PGDAPTPTPRGQASGGLRPGGGAGNHAARAAEHRGGERPNTRAQPLAPRTQTGRQAQG